MVVEYPTKVGVCHPQAHVILTSKKKNINIYIFKYLKQLYLFWVCLINFFFAPCFMCLPLYR